MSCGQREEEGKEQIEEKPKRRKIGREPESKDDPKQRQEKLRREASLVSLVTVTIAFEARQLIWIGISWPVSASLNVKGGAA